MNGVTADGSAGIERPAAFFDLDKTVIARASLAAFRGPLRENGFLTAGGVARALAGQLIYLHLGAREERMERLAASLLRLATGWRERDMKSLVEATLEKVVDPIIYAEAVDLIELHKAAGDLVAIVSAAPAEIVEPLGRHLGVAEVIATRAELDEDGRYTGRIASYVHGARKAAAIEQFAGEHRVDLSRSYAYTDSASDLPLLEAVGHPIAVNPDRALARIAQERGWEVRRFERPVRLRERVRVREPSPLAIGVTSVVMVASAAGLAWRFHRRQGARRDRLDAAAKRE